MKMTATQEIGCYIEYDSNYDKGLHNLHNDLPLNINNIPITKDMLSLYNKKMLEKNRVNHTKYTKLVSTLLNKVNYVSHYQKYIQDVQLGMKVTKIHKVLYFKQSPWMKPYIDYNSVKYA